ncbi:MAG: hypothetical protein EZS28_013848 [Streblomastix strix]|uniref:Uncharacterized protein n=1 Tax=Streblomastix strix TaxID=222440 RepID=A0A5J4W7E5_9EUKA|nr:MAG: hypothetical protein EZS28_013848 [Streblomastix strix]
MFPKSDNWLIESQAPIAVVAVLVPLKFVLDLANSMAVNIPYVKLTLFNYIPIVLAGVIIVQLTRQIQTQQQVALPLVLNGARVNLVPPEVKVFLGQSKNSYLDMVNDQVSIVNVLNTSFSADGQMGSSSSSQSYGAVSGPLGAINPNAGMIARDVGEL